MRCMELTLSRARGLFAKNSEPVFSSEVCLNAELNQQRCDHNDMYYDGPKVTVAP